MITGIKAKSLELEDSCIGNYFLGVLVRHRVSNFRFWYINVYGPANHELSANFMQELSTLCTGEALPVMLGEDFNLTRNNRDRNQGQGDQRLMDLFNGFIGNFQLREIFTSGARFTWSSRQKVPTLVKLDRILITESWEVQYPTCFSWSKARISSDHSPILLNSGENGDVRPRYFFFEDHWFKKEGFMELIRDKWVEIRREMKDSTYSMDVWHDCLQRVRKYLRGWNLKLLGE